MKKRFIALSLSLLLILSAATPARIYADIPDEPSESSEVLSEDMEEITEDTALPEENPDTDFYFSTESTAAEEDILFEDEEEFSIEPAQEEFAIEEEPIFSLSDTSAVPKGGHTYRIRSVSSSSLYLAPKSRSTKNNARIQFTEGSDNAQYFTVKRMKGGDIVLQNYVSGKALTSPAAGSDSSTKFTQTEPVIDEEQQYIMNQNEDGSITLLLRSDKKKALTSDRKTPKAGSGLVARTYNKKLDTQKFIFEEVSLPDYTKADLVLRPATGLYNEVSPKSGSKKSGTTLVLAGFDGLSIRSWKLQHVWGGYYAIINKKTGLAISVSGWKAADGSDVIAENYAGNRRQQWKPIKNKNGTYSFYSRLRSDAVLESSSGKKGANICIGTADGSKKQTFRLTYVRPLLDNGTKVQISSALNTDRVLHAKSSAEDAKIILDDYSNKVSKKFIPELVKLGSESRSYYRIQTSHGYYLSVSGNKAADGTALIQSEWKAKKGQYWIPKLGSDGTISLRSALNNKYAITVSDNSRNYGTGIVIEEFSNKKAQKFYIDALQMTSCKITDGKNVTVKGNGTKLSSDKNEVYLFSVPSYVHSIKDYKPCGSVEISDSVKITVPLNKDTSDSLLQNKFYFAVKTYGKYRIVSNAFYITNPQNAASNKKSFPKASRGTKKGLKILLNDYSINQAVNLKCSHVLVDLPLEGFLRGSGYTYYYEGKAYSFSTKISECAALIKRLNNSGIVVSGVFYLTDKSLTSYILPSAVSGSNFGSATICALNTANSNRKKLEALFSALADAFTTNGVTLANWIYGNEWNQPYIYNYSGEISYSVYHETLAESFRMFNTAVKSRWKNARTYISLDHKWNLSKKMSGVYNSMKLTKDFNTDLERMGKVHWDMAMHPYSSPEQDPRFWNADSYVTDAADSQKITMLNIAAFAKYIKETYGSDTHIILSETGLNSRYNSVDMQNEQAAAIALAYYLTEFNEDLDMIGFHREMDDPAEVALGWSLGLYEYGGSTFGAAKKSANVFRYMDTSSYAGAVNQYLAYIGVKKWSRIVPGFDGGRFS